LTRRLSQASTLSVAYQRPRATPWLLAVALLMAAGTAKAAVAPVTHRHQDMTFTSGEVNRYAAKAYHRMLDEQRRRGLLDREPVLLHQVRGIAARVIAQGIRLKLTAGTWDWEVHITDSDDVDAFCMAGGKLLIGTHFIRRYRLSTDELAIVIAHEVAHALAEHVREQLSEVQLRRPRLEYQSVADAAHDMNANLGLYLSLMPLSRTQELEADRIGLRLAARAGFPPHAALEFYAKMARGEDSGRRSLLATHPDERKRDRLVKQWVIPASRIYRASLSSEQPPAYKFR